MHADRGPFHFAIHGFDRAAFQVAEVGGIHGEFAGEGTPQRFISRNQGAQALVYLAVFPLPALLDRLHREQSDADADEGYHGKSEQGRQQRLPGREI